MLSSSRLNLDPMNYPVVSFVSQLYSARYEFPPVKQRKMVGNSIKLTPYSLLDKAENKYL